MGFPRYKGDPYWITTRFAGKCLKCGRAIKRGERAFYYPRGERGRNLYCDADECGRQAERQFVAEAQDEAFLTGTYY